MTVEEQLVVVVRLTDRPHKMRIEGVKGTLCEPRAAYGTWAYWHGAGSGGWHSKPASGQRA